MPIYTQYTKLFFQNIVENTRIGKDFADFKDTSIYERYMLNAAQFSAAKSDAESKMIQSLVFDDNHVRQGYSAFKADAKEVTDIFNETWLRVEYDTSVRQAVAAEQFRSYRADKDLYPFWRYLHTTSRNPNIEHLQLVGNVYRIGDPESDAVFPPGNWNCSCGSEQLSGMDMDEGGLSARTNEEAKADLDNEVNPQFRFNPADRGILPKESHTYFEILPNANAANGDLFNISGSSKNQTGLAAKGLHNMVALVHQWKHDYHSDVKGTLTFQNKELYSNVIFNHKSFKAIQNNSAGFDQLADTVTNPDEVWSYWLDTNKQTITLRNYIKGNYVVKTQDGIITNAYLVDNVSRFRKGVIIA